MISVCLVLVARTVPVWQEMTPFLGWMLLAGAAWLGAVWLASRGRGSIALVVVGAVLMRGVGLSSWPDASDDIYRYAWEGALVGEGISPYALAPDSAELDEVRAQMPGIFEAMNNPGISAAYPPVTQAACAVAVRMAKALDHEVLWSLRLFFTLCDLLVILPLCVLLRRLGRPAVMVVGWAWCPLVVLEFSGSGHFDSLGILLLLSGLALVGALSSGARRLGACALGAAVSVKYLPLAALPFVAREKGGAGRVLLALAVALASFTPLIWMTGGLTGIFDGLGAYGLRWQSSGIIHPFVAQIVERFLDSDGSLLDARRVTRLILGGVWMGVAAWVWRRRLSAVRSTGILLGAFLILSPTLHPWYVTWIVPFVALRPQLSWMWLILTIPSYYEILETWKIEGIWEQSPAMHALVGLPLLLLFIIEGWRARRSTVTT